MKFSVLFMLHISVYLIYLSSVYNPMSLSILLLSSLNNFSFTNVVSIRLDYSSFTHDIFFWLLQFHPCCVPSHSSSIHAAFFSTPVPSMLRSLDHSSSIHGTFLATPGPSKLHSFLLKFHPCRVLWVTLVPSMVLSFHLQFHPSCIPSHSSSIHAAFSGSL